METERIKMIFVTTDEMREDLRAASESRATSMSGLINLFKERRLENIDGIYTGEPTSTPDLSELIEKIDRIDNRLEQMQSAQPDGTPPKTADSTKGDKEPAEPAKEPKKAPTAAQQAKKDKAKADKAAREEMFEEFWELYPRRVKRKRANQRWHTMKVNEEMHKEIMGGLKKYLATEWKDEKMGYIPHPSTWLNQERWKDEIGGENGRTGECLRTGTLRNASGGAGTTSGVIGNIAGGKKQP